MAVLNYTVMPDAATQAMIKARGDTIQIVPPAAPAGAPAANAPGASPYFPNPYLSGPQTVHDMTGTQPLNNSFFANQDTASRLAAAMGGTVTTEPGWGGTGISSNTNSYGVNVNGRETNPALTADWVNKYGPQYAATLAGTPGLANLGQPTPPAGAAPTGVSPAAATLGGGGATLPGQSTMSTGPSAGGTAPPWLLNRVQNNPTTPGGPTYPSFPPANGNGTTTGVGPNPISGGGPGGSLGIPQNPTGAAPGALPTFQPAGTTDYTGGYQQWPTPGMPLNDVVGNSTDITKRILSDRDLALGQGGALTGRFGGFADQSAARSAALQQQQAAAYAPIAAGEGGYTSPEKNAILREQELYGLKTTPGEFAGNYLTGNEQSNILGNPEAGTQAFQTGAGAMRDVYGNEAANVGGTLGAGAAAVRGTINPNQLRASSDFMQNYQWTPQMTQAMTDAAARGEMARTQATQQDIANRAFAQGNVSPAALAAMEDRARQTGDVASADAMTDARLRAQEAALGVTQGREQTRLGAEQGLAGLSSANEQQLAQRATGAGLELGGQQLGAEQYLTGAGIGTAQTGEQEAAQRNAYLGQNRQSINAYNQGQKFQQGMGVNQTASDRNTQFANARMQQEGEYRNNYLGGQQQQANQNVTVGNQQQLGTFGTQMGGANEADKNAIYNKSLPGLAQKLLGFKWGGTIKGPTMALVGEKGPEAIVPLRRPGMVPRMPRVAAPRYALPTSYLPRTTTGMGFNRLLPKFDDGGVVDPEVQAGAIPDTSTPWWKTALALGLAGGLGRSPLLGGVAGDLAGRITGQNKSDPRNIAAGLAKSTIGRNNPALGKGVGDVIAPPPASPGRDKDTGFYQGTVIPNVFAPNPYPRSADNLTLIGGGSPAAPKVAAKPIPRNQTTPRQITPPAAVNPPWTPPKAIPPTPEPSPIPRNLPPPRAPIEHSDSTFKPDLPGLVGWIPPKPVQSPIPGKLPPQQTEPIGVGTGRMIGWNPDPNALYDPNTGSGNIGSGAGNETGTGNQSAGAGEQTGGSLIGWNPDPNASTDPLSPFPTTDPNTGESLDPYTGLPIGTGMPDPNPIYQPDPTGGAGGGDYGGGAGSGGGGGWPNPEDPVPIFGSDALGELVTQPSVRMLGEAGPEAVVPLTPRPGNKVTPDMLPALIRKYSGRHTRNFRSPIAGVLR